MIIGSGVYRCSIGDQNCFFVVFIVRYNQNNREIMRSKGNKRRDRIQQVVQEQGAVRVGALAEMLGVTMQTIRRDLDVLCDGEVLRRSHGRIELSPGKLNAPFDERAGMNRVGKRSIAALVAAMIPNGSTVFLSIGSTPLAVAKALVRRQKLTVITNNLGAAMALSGEVSNRILLPGGELRLPDRDLLAEETAQRHTPSRPASPAFGASVVDTDPRSLAFQTAPAPARLPRHRT